MQLGQNRGSIDSFWFIPAIAIVIIAVLVVYKLLFPNLTKIKTSPEAVPPILEKKEKNFAESPRAEDQEIQDKPGESEKELLDKARVEAALKVLGGNEQKVVQELMDHGGSMLQKEISWETGFSRVKTHRVLVRLLNRDLVSAEKYYNTNRITLANWLSKGASMNKQVTSQSPKMKEEDLATKAIEEDK